MPSEPSDEAIQPDSSVVGISPTLSPGETNGELGSDVSLPWVSLPLSGVVLFAVWFCGEFCVQVAGGILQAILYSQGDLDSTARTWLGVWATLVALPFRLTVAVYLVRVFAAPALAQLGLTRRHLLRHVALGVGLALPVALVAYGVQFGCEELSRRYTPTLIAEHLFTRLARQGLTPGEWTLVSLAAVIAAPLWEELLFRGMIQPWGIVRRWGGVVLMGLAVFVAVLFRSPEVTRGWREGREAFLIELVPAFAALGMLPIYFVLREAFRSPVPSAIFAGAVLFGWFHASVWPSPVALTLLGVALGFLTWRTRSLTAAVALHATFNAIAVVMLLTEPWWRG